MWNIVIGLIFIVGGLSGQLALRGTDNSPLLAVVGAGLVVWGIVQMVRSRTETTNAPQNAPAADREER